MRHKRVHIKKTTHLNSLNSQNEILQISLFGKRSGTVNRLLKNNHGF